MLIMPAIFVYSLILNDVEDRKIEQAQDEQSSLESELLSYQNLESSAARVIGKTEVYKKAESGRISMSQPLEITLSRIPQNVMLDIASISSNRVSLVVRSPSALDFPILISNYFQEQSVSEITLTSAELNVTDNLFVMNLDVIFK
jgi:hypothetical protein